MQHLSHRLRLFCLLGIVAAAWLTAAPVRAQTGDVRIFNPPVVNVELSGVEPAPPDAISETISYGGGGGCGGEIDLDCAGDFFVNPVQWVWNPTNTYPLHPIRFVACGYNASAPSGLLVTPSGKEKTVSPEKIPEVVIDGTPTARNNCYQLFFTFDIGDELGTYTLKFDDADGNLSTTFTTDYPPCRIGIRSDGTDGHSKMVYMGFYPDEVLTLYFYNAKTVPLQFLASRKVKVDSNGALVMDISLPRSSGISIGAIYFEPGQPDLTKLPPAKYPTYMPGGYHSSECFGVLDNRNAVVVPQQGDTVPLYADDGTTVLKQLQRGDPVELRDFKVVNTNGMLVPQALVSTEDGAQGTVYGKVLVEAMPRHVPGMTNEFADLRTEPDDNASMVAGAEKARLFTYISRTDKVSPLTYQIYWLVKTDNGLTGYATCAGVSGCPTIWKPSVVDASAINSIQSGGGGSASGGSGGSGGSANPPTVACAGFNLSSRVSIGMTARVNANSGSANFLNSEPARPSLDPTSKALGKIPVYGSFNIVGGPTCQHKILWWQVTWNGITGWTGEGTGNEYWIEPGN